MTAATIETTHYGSRPDGAGDCLHKGPRGKCTGPDCADAKTTTGVRVLTVRQPWADSIAHGTKRTENRTRLTKYRGVLWIHAGLLGDRQAVLDGVLPGPDIRGAVLATARLVGCHQATEGCCAPWGQPNVWHWDLDDVQALPTPVPARGALGLWTPSNAVVLAVRAQQQKGTLS